MTFSSSAVVSLLLLFLLSPIQTPWGDDSGEEEENVVPQRTGTTRDSANVLQVFFWVTKRRAQRASISAEFKVCWMASRGRLHQGREGLSIHEVITKRYSKNADVLQKAAAACSTNEILSSVAGSSSSLGSRQFQMLTKRKPRCAQNTSIFLRTSCLSFLKIVLFNLTMTLNCMYVAVDYWFVWINVAFWGNSRFCFS